jgi:hypothetical protein
MHVYLDEVNKERKTKKTKTITRYVLFHNFTK